MATLIDRDYEEKKEDYFQGQREMFGDIDCLHGFEIIALLSSTTDDYI